MPATDATTAAIRDLVLILADSKRLLGMRYAGWILGAPELEAGIACASMAQDEWGHARLLYALLKDFDEDVARLEHEREPSEYRNIDVLDRAPDEWPALVVLNTLVDGALTVQFEALRASDYAPIRQRVEKLLEEERFHEAHGVAWFHRLARAGDASRSALTRAVQDALPRILRWFGPDSAAGRALQEASITDAAGSTLRTRFLERSAPLIAELDMADTLASIEPDFRGFDDSTRRSGGQPDAETIERIRGDRNRAFLMD